MYHEVIAPEIDGYTATPQKIPALEVSDYDLEKTITYKANKPQAKPEDYEKKSTLTIVFTGAGENTPKPIVESATWTRSLKLLADGSLENTPWQANLENYPQIKVPVVKGYHADQKIVQALKVSQDNLKQTINYEKNGAFIPVDQDGQQLAPSLVYQTDPEDASRVLEKPDLPEVDGYLLPDKLPQVTDPAQDQEVIYQRKEQYFLVDVDHPNPEVDSEEYQKTVKFVVKFAGAGDETPEPVVQKIELLRKLTLDQDGKIVDGKYTTDWDSAGQNFKAVTIPIIDGYRCKQKIVPAPKDLTDSEVTVSYQKNIQKGEIKFVQIIHFVDENGQKLADDREEEVFFSRSQNGQWTQKIANFKNIEAPVIDGYFTDHKMIAGKSVMPDEKRQVEIKVIYHKLGSIIPINQDGEIIKNSEAESTVKVFENDPLDATKALMNQAVPKIAGFVPAKETVSPEDAAINIPVLYQEE